MQRPPAQPGDRLDEIDTPALILDLDAFESNLATMAALARQAGVRLRPHAKSHKCAQIALRQVASGAVGVCVQKVSEAEALADAGIDDILICNELVGARKVAAFAALHRRCKVAACVDHSAQVGALAAAGSADHPLRVLVEVDVGQGRCGVPPVAVPGLVAAIASAPALSFAGLHAYHGGAQHVRGIVERRAAALAAIERARQAVNLLREAGFDCPLVTGAGTGTFEHEAASGVYQEIQPGSYVFMDADYDRNEWAQPTRFRQSLFVLCRVMSVRAGQAVVDAGLKASSVDSGLPVVADRVELAFERLSDEHGVLRTPAGGLQLGELLRLVPGHCDPTVNLYDWIVAVRGERVEHLWPVTARGALA
jgi:D-serine deaminase-like pyridoxal phosphate-dependent protein